MNRRWIVWTVLLELFLAGLLLRFLDLPHGFRAVVLRIRETSDRAKFDWNPKNAPDWFRSDPPHRYQDFRSEAENMIGRETDPLQQSAAVMRSVRAFGRRGPRAPPPDFPRLTREHLKRGYGVMCGHYSLVLFSYLKSLGFDIRLVGMEGKDRLGGIGHTAVELWLDPPGKWILLDPLNNAFFTRNHVPLSLLEIRDMVYDGTLDQLEIHQQTPYTIRATYLPRFYARLLSNVSITGDNDFIAKEESRFGVLQGWAPLFDALPRPARRILEKLLS